MFSTIFLAVLILII